MQNKNRARYDVIDLLSERHQLLRELLEEHWNNEHDISISNTEWYILSKVYQNNHPPLSIVTKHINISRQAIHKQVKNLEAKGLVLIENVKYNKKEKCLVLTEEGKTLYEKYEVLKASLEEKIASEIGEENMKMLKEILQLDWGIE